MDEIRIAIWEFLRRKYPRTARLSGGGELSWEEIGMDSLDVAELLVHLERKFGFDFMSQEDVPPLTGVEALAGFVRRCPAYEHER